ncbi:hypothetical protein F511_28803 [Dorcoceras hygrometricum]|uniref:Uncharacterized protein n=1 Tax=Dorcoceras hygrometricum TaxID=472368 RepID=A0A2Z7BC38_9LAMI|nr:hypothetical protein F511_28803 [Dorcoceras hygrometricum]
MSASRKIPTVQDDWIAEDLSDFGGAGFPVNFSFDCYPFEAAERPWRRSRKLLVSGRTSGNQAGPSGSSAGRSPRP